MSQRHNKAPLNGAEGYARGQQAAKAFLSRDPDISERKRHWHHADCGRDDYDRGYADALNEARRDR
jgi:hypothetical protein